MKKCDKLPLRTIYVDCLGRTICYYDPYEVNEAIEELKAENEILKNKLYAANKQCENLITSASKLMLRQDKLIDAKCNEIKSLKSELEK